MTRAEASLFAEPWRYVEATVRAERKGNRETRAEDGWWLLQRARPEMKAALRPLARCIVTARVAKHRVFTFVPACVVADSQVVVFTRADDTTFGILHGRFFHELWSLRMCTWLGKGNDPRYTPTTCFETFPFPLGLTPADTAHQRTEPLGSALIPADLTPAVRLQAEAIAHAAQQLNALRERWLNPPDWTRRKPEVTPLGMAHSPYPDRTLPREGFEAQLAQRTLTKLYNERPAWLAHAHETLDAAVAAAHGWADYNPAMADEEILRRLLALNRERAA